MRMDERELVGRDAGDTDAGARAVEEIGAASIVSDEVVVGRNKHD